MAVNEKERGYGAGRERQQASRAVRVQAGGIPVQWYSR